MLTTKSLRSLQTPQLGLVVVLHHHRVNVCVGKQQIIERAVVMAGNKLQTRVVNSFNGAQVLLAQFLRPPIRGASGLEANVRDLRQTVGLGNNSAL